MNANDHWAPNYLLCHPCELQYDLITHLETIDDDNLEMAKHLRIEGLFNFPKINSKSQLKHEDDLTLKLVQLYKSQNITIDTLEKLYKAYQPDFDLFGYDFKHFIKIYKET